MVGVVQEVAIVGGGMMGNVHLRSAKLAGAKIRGVLGSSPIASERLRSEWGLAEAYPTMESLAADNEVGTVHVCSPNYAHFDQVATLLRAGKNVICEKPITTSLTEALELNEIAKSSSGRVTVPYVYRFHPMVREIKSLADGGHFGRWLTISGSYLQDWLWHSSDSNWRVDSQAGGKSRTFADIGSHWCDLVEWLTGEEIVELLAETSTVHETRQGLPVDTDDLTSVLARTRSGVLISATFSQVSPGRKNRLFFELAGDRASVIFDQEQPESIEIGGDKGFEKLVRNPQSNSASANKYSLVPAGHPQGYLECFENFVADSYRYFSSESPDGLPTLESGVRSLKLVDAVVKSAASRNWVKVS